MEIIIVLIFKARSIKPTDANIWIMGEILGKETLSKRDVEIKLTGELGVSKKGFYRTLNLFKKRKLIYEKKSHNEDFLFISSDIKKEVNNA